MITKIKTNGEAKKFVQSLTQMNYNHNRGTLGMPYSKGLEKMFGKEQAQELERNYKALTIRKK